MISQLGYEDHAAKREEKCINMIIAYWAERGLEAKIEIVNSSIERGTYYRSNIINGWIK